MKRLTMPRLLEPKSITFGVTVLYFVWTAAAWLRAPLGYVRYGAPDYHFNLFMAALLFGSAAGLVLNRAWSKLLAAILCGQVPLAFILIFWIVAQDAEALPFSPRHINRWLSELARMPKGAWLWLPLSIIILSYAVPSIVRAGTRRTVSDGCLVPPLCVHVAQAQLHGFTTHATSAGLRVHHHADLS